MRTKAQPHNPLGHYQKREPVRQSRWSKNGLDHMLDHSYNHFISGCSAVGSAPALGAGCREFKSPHSDQNSVKSFDFTGFSLFLLQNKQNTLKHFPVGKLASSKAEKACLTTGFPPLFLPQTMQPELFMGRITRFESYRIQSGLSLFIAC